MDCLRGRRIQRMAKPDGRVTYKEEEHLPRAKTAVGITRTADVYLCR